MYAMPRRGIWKILVFLGEAYAEYITPIVGANTEEGKAAALITIQDIAYIQFRIEHDVCAGQHFFIPS